MPSLIARLFGRYTPTDGFAQAHREAIVDLLLLAMYSDARVEGKEDDIIDRQLEAFTWESGTDPRTYLAVATHRVREALESAEALERLLAGIGTRLDTAASRTRALELLAHLLDADGRNAREAALLTRVTMLLA